MNSPSAVREGAEWSWMGMYLISVGLLHASLQLGHVNPLRRSLSSGRRIPRESRVWETAYATTSGPSHHVPPGSGDQAALPPGCNDFKVNNYRLAR